jgi:hypothetical protein
MASARSLLASACSLLGERLNIAHTRGFAMTSLTRSFALFSCFALAGASFGCAAAVDDSAPTTDEAASTQDQTLKIAAAPVDDVAADAAAADCDAAPATGTGSYQELTSILESSSVARDDGNGLMSTCTRVCACCRRGNRFCCAHCKFCSGPIGPYGVAQ